MSIKSELQERLEGAKREYARHEDSDKHYIKYFEIMFPVVKEIFDERLQEDVDNGRLNLTRPKLMISLVGFATPPVVLSVLAQRPEKLYLLFTRESMRFRHQLIKQIKKYWNDAPEPVPRNVNGSDPVCTYRAIREIWSESCGNEMGPEDVALDITGGKKTMTGGAFAAACVLGFRIWYVDSEYDPEKERPKEGTEYYRSIFSPLKVFSQQDIEKARKLFDTSHYEEAYTILKEILINFQDPIISDYIPVELRQDLEKLAAWAECYMHWDNTEYLKAKEVLDRTLLANVDDPHYRFIGILAPLREYQRQIESSEPHSEASEVSNKALSQIFDRDINRSKRGEFAFYFALDMYLSALRRKNQGNYDDAVIRMARAVDICAQYPIYDKHGTIYRQTLGQRLKQIRLEQLRHNDLYKVSGIRKLVDLRNNLVIIHNTSPALRKEVEEVQPALMQLLENSGSQHWKSSGLAASFGEFMGIMQLHSWEYIESMPNLTVPK